MGSHINTRNSRIGLRIGRLVVLRYLGPIIPGKKATFYEVRCDCGKITKARWGDLNKKEPSKRMKSCGCICEAKPNTSSITMAFSNCQRSARVRKYSFELTFEQWYELTQKPCHYCGIVGANSATAHPARRKSYKPKPFIYNGIDRVDSSLGYILDNCVPCCKFCNLSKSNRTKKDFLDWIESVYLHSIAKGVTSACSTN